MAPLKPRWPKGTGSRSPEVIRRSSRIRNNSSALSLRRGQHPFSRTVPPSFTTIITTTATACLVLATTASSTTHPQGSVISTAAAKAEGCCRRRGLEEYASRGCFVLCVTPASASSEDHPSGTVRRQRCSRELRHASVFGRTRAGTVASRSLEGSFARGNDFGRQNQQLMGARGLRGEFGLWGSKNDSAADERLKSKRRSRIRRIFDRMVGRVHPRADTASAAMIYDTQEEEDVTMDLSQIRAGGNTSTFDADARCPTCRPLVPYIKANMLSKLLFSWVTPLLVLGNRKFLEEQDLWDLPENRQMHTVADAFEAAYAQESEVGAATVTAKPQGEGDEAGAPAHDSGGGQKVRRRKSKHPLVPSMLDVALLRALWTLYKGPFLWAGVIRFLNTSVQFLPAILVQRLLRLLESGIAAGGAEAVRQAYLTCLMLFSVVTVKTTIENQYFYRLSNLGIDIRGALSTAVYRKSLRLSPSARQNATVGEMVNLMQLDAGRLESLPASLHTVWDSVFQLVGYTVLLFACLGPSVLAGISLLVLLTPLNTFFFQRLSSYRAKILTQTDLRVKLVSEMLQGIRAIKFYNWESPFREKVEKIHNAELDIMRRSAIMRSLLAVILTTTPALVIVITLGIYSMLGNPLMPSKVFTALTLFNQIRLPLYFLPVTLSSLAEAQVAIDRLSKFFNAAEVAPYVQRVNGSGDVPVQQHPGGAVSGSGRVGGRTYPDDVCISMKEGAFSWTGSESVEDESVPGEQGVEDENSLLLLRRRGRSTVSPVLHGCTLQVNKGELVAVVGAVGSGKSSLLSALLGDMKHVSGEVYATGSLAYVPQTAWIPNDSVRNNILFGQPFDDDEYRRVIRVCRLERDLQLLENGDMTEIGEQGINLSGGQKQRLSIARAMYSDAELFLLDDPLSALDAEVGKHVFEGCIRDGLAGKTRILVTNQLQFLPQADKIVVMGTLPGAEGATIVDQGTYQDLVARGRDLTNILNDQVTSPMTLSETESAVSVTPTTVKDEEEHEEVEQQPELHHTETEVTGSPSHHEGVSHAEAVGGAERGGIGELLGGSGGTVPSMMDEGLFSHRVMKEGECGPLDLSEYKKGEGGSGGRGMLITAEERSTGAVPGRVYRDYFTAAGSSSALAGLLGLFLVSNFSVQLQQWVVSFWTSDPGYTKHSLGFYLTGVAASAGLVGVFSHLRTILGFHLGLRASKRLHGALIRRVLHAPVSFFDTTPVGRIVQRFSKDTDQIDQQLISQISMMINAGLGVVGAGGAIIVATPVFTLGMVPLSWVYLTVMNYFRQVARELKRLDSITRSPIYAHFGETLGGLSVIRAFGHVKLFARANERLVDNNLSSYFALKVVDRWLSVRLELLGNVVVLSATLLSIFAVTKGRLIAGLAGLSISNALSMTGLLNWGVRCFTETETMMNSVERVLFTSQETPQEPPHHVSRPRHPYYHQLSGLTGAALPVSPREDTQLATCPDDRLLLTTGWPWEGRIEFRDGVTMRYRPDTDLVLKGVTLTIRPGEKIGIVGRTGSGKSSLMQVLFRMVDCDEGSIAIDGVDTKAIGLSALRSRLTIIPQDPVLFSGTLRDNLDPFNVYTDEEVWDALEQASLGPTVRGYPNGLHETVAEYGESLSAGQKQLVCLARALLRKTRVLLLDEATSSVDYETDRVIQSTLRSAFRDCTVLTIAHRLNTIMDSDRILVMEDGRVAEIDSPSSLLEDTDSHFSRLLSSERQQLQEVDVTDALDEEVYAGGGVGINGDRVEDAHTKADGEAADGVEVDKKVASVSTEGAPSGPAQ